MEEREEEGVITEESPVSEEYQQEESVVNDETESSDQSQERVEVEPSLEQGNVPLDRPIQNYEAEWKRKYDNLEKQVQELVQTSSTPKEKEYTVQELERFAAENPDYRPWVEEQKEKIREQRLEKKLVEIQQRTQQEQQAAMIRQRSEATVVNSPHFKDAFLIKNGSAQWNPSSELAKRMQQVLQDPRVQQDPRGIEYAAKMAYADLVLEGKVQPNTPQLSTLKRQNTKLTQKTLTEGGGSPVAPQKGDPYKNSLERLKKTGSKQDSEAAIANFFSRQ